MAYRQYGEMRTGLAVAALILGLLGVLCVGPFGGIPAIVLGSIALRKARRRPDEYGGGGIARWGIGLGVASLILSVVGLVTFNIVNSAVQARARAAAQLAENRDQDAANVRALALAIRQYANANHGHFPPDLAAVYKYVGSTKRFVSPHDTEPLSPAPSPDADWKSYASDLNEHCDYLYVGADLDSRVARPGIIVVYTKDTHLGGRSFAFADGSGQFTDEKEFEAFFESTNGWRADLNLQTLMIDGPPPAPRSERAAATPANPDPGAAARQKMELPPPPPPPPPRLRLTFANVDDALAVFDAGQPEERRAALKYLERTSVDARSQLKVTHELERFLLTPEYRDLAMAAMKPWATKENVPAIRTMLESLITRDYDGHALDNDAACKTAIEILLQFKDVESAECLARCLRSSEFRGDAEKGLLDFGSQVEEALHPIAKSADTVTAQEACKILRSIGTQKSIPVLQKLAGDKNNPAARAAVDAIQEIAARLKLDPESYNYPLMKPLIIAPPVGFAADKIGEPNTRQWSRTGPGRGVKSVYTVRVSAVEAGFQLGIAETNPALEAQNGLIFRQKTVTATPPTKTAEWAATTGDCVIEITAVGDTFDKVALESMANAVKKIGLKETEPK